jgi:tetratricopeptide (TPR) repeat protein
MGTPPEDEAKVAAEAANLDVVALDEDELAQPALGRTRSRSLPPPIPERKKRATLARADGALAAERTLSRLDERDPAKRAVELAELVEMASQVDPAAAAIRAYELGELHEKLGDDASALAAYRNAVALDPSLRVAAWSLRRVLERAGAWPELGAALSGELARATVDDERRNLRLERAIALERAGDDAGARADLQDIVAHAPMDQSALFELYRLVARAGDTAAEIDTAQLLADAIDDPERKAARWFELARRMVACGDARADIAFDSAATAVGAIASPDLRWESSSAEGGAASIADARGRTLAERIARDRLVVAATRDAPALARALVLADALVSGDRERGHALTRRRELVVYRRRHAVLVRGEQPEQAWELLQQAHAAAPEEPLVLVELVELAEELGRHHELPRLVDAWRALETPAALAEMVSCWCAEAHVVPEQRSARRALLAQITSVVPGFVLATSAVECEVLATAARARDRLALVDAYRATAEAARNGTWLGPRVAAAADASAAATLWVQAAYVLAAYVATPASNHEARLALERALEAVPNHPAAIEQYVELDAATGRAGDAIRRLCASAGDDRTIVERAIGLAYGHGLWTAAWELERELVRRAPNDFALAWQLEATLTRIGLDDAREELVAKLAVDDVDETRRRIALYHIAQERERAGDGALAVDTYRKLLELSPDDAFARDALHDHLRTQRRWKELAASRLREARDAPKPPGETSVPRPVRSALREAAWVLELGASEPGAAATIYDEWLARAPGDRTALDGVARCRDAMGDHAGAIAARRAIVETDATPEARWLYARSLERAGDHDAAAAAYRELFAAETDSVARACATLALADFAARRDDVAMRFTVLEALAARTRAAPLAAGLHESNGWAAAIVLDDLERAQRAFAAALALEPTRQGALLGAALTAGRGQDATAREACLTAFARAVDAPTLSVALLVRAAVMLAARGHLEVAFERAAAARSIVPDYPTALVVAAELRPSRSPRLAHAELLAGRITLVDDPVARASWQLDRADALAVGGDLRAAAEAIAEVRKLEPNNRRALWALRAIARHVGDITAAARASYALADVSRDARSRVQLLREAVVIYDRGDAAPAELDRALAIYTEIVALDGAAPEVEHRLSLLRDRGSDDRAVVTALSDRLDALAAVDGNDEAVVALLVERATTLRRLDLDVLAIADLDVALARAPLHSEALRLRAGVALDASDFAIAMAMLKRYLATEIPQQQRAGAQLLYRLALDRASTEPRIDNATPPTGEQAIARAEPPVPIKPTRAPPPALDRILFATDEAPHPDPSGPIAIAFPDDRAPSPYDAASDPARLREYYERELAHPTPPAETAALHLEAGRACEATALVDEARAHYDAALVAAPQTAAALRGLRRLAWASGDLAEVARTIDVELPIAGSHERTALARYRIDVLMATGEQDLARVAVGEVLDHAPNAVAVLLANLELAFLDKRVDDERSALEQLEQAAIDPPLRAALRAARAALAERLGDRTGAIAWAYEGEGVESPAVRLRALHDAVGHDNRDDVGAAAFDLACELEPDDPIIAAALAVRACDWIARQTPETEATRELLAASAQLMARAAPIDPLVARAGTEAALAAGDQALAAHRFAWWARCTSSPTDRAYAAARAAELDPSKLGRLWTQVHELDRDDDYAAAQLRAAYIAAGEPNLAVEVDIQLARDGERAHPLIRAAALLAEVSDFDSAIALLQSGRAHQPGSIAITDALVDLLAQRDSTRDRAAVLAEFAAASHGGARDLARWRAALAWHDLARAALAGEAPADDRRRAVLAALDAWDAVLATDPHSAPAHAAAIALADLHDEVIVFEAVLARAQAAERSPWAASSLLLRRAQLAWRDDTLQAPDLSLDAELDDPRRAVAAMLAAAQRGELGGAAAVLEARAKRLDATRGDASRSIEAATLRLRAAQLALDANQVAHARELLAAVAAVAPGLADDLVDAAARRAGEPPPDAARIAARTNSFVRAVREADAAEARGNGAAALALYRRALELRPDEPFATIPLVARAWMLRDPAPIAAFAKAELRRAETTRDAAAQADAHEVLARLDEELRGNATSAEVALELALRADPTRIDLLPRLERHFATARRYDDVLRLRRLELDQLRARGGMPPRDLAALAGDAANLAARARSSDDDRAALLRVVLEADPQDRRALLGLEAILRRAGDRGADELVQLYDRVAMQLASSDSALARSAYLFRAGELHAAAGRPADAIARFASAFDATPSFLPALDAWHRAAVDAQLWHEVARAATRRAELGGDPHVVAALHHFAAVTLLDKAGHRDDAMAAFRRALAADPRHPEAFRQLRALLEAGDHRDELVALLQRRLDGESDPAAQIALHRSLAELRADADERDLAVQHYRGLLRVDPTDVRAHAAIADLTTDARRWEEASEAVIARIRVEKEPRALGALYARLGRIYAPHDARKALAAFQRALSYSADDRATLRAIVDVAIAAGDWQLALDSCDRVVVGERDADQQALYLMRAATIFDRGFNDRARAERMLELACERAPTSEYGVELLVRFFASDDAALRPHLDRLADAMRARIAANPLDGPAYRTLSRAAAASIGARGDGQRLIARVAAELAELLGSAGDEERRLLAEPPRPQLAMLADGGEAQLFFDAGQAPVRALFRRAGSPLAKGIGFELSGFGVGRKHRVDAADPRAAIARDVARGLGLDDVHLYVSDRDPRVIAAVPTSPPSLVLGTSIVSGHERLVRFACCSGLALARIGLAVPAQLAPDQLAAVGAGLARVVRADAPVAGVPADEANARAAHLARALPSRVVDELRRAGDAPTCDADAFSRELWIASVRAGTCATGSILPALVVVAETPSIDPHALLANPIVRAVVAFALRDAVA